MGQGKVLRCRLYLYFRMSVFGETTGPFFMDIPRIISTLLYHGMKMGIYDLSPFAVFGPNQS